MKLPSYAAADYPTTREKKLWSVFKIIGPYLPPAHLVALCHVSRASQVLFQPYLWTNPLQTIMQLQDIGEVEANKGVTGSTTSAKDLLAWRVTKVRKVVSILQLPIRRGCDPTMVHNKPQKLIKILDFRRLSWRQCYHATENILDLRHGLSSLFNLKVLALGERDEDEDFMDPNDSRLCASSSNWIYPPLYMLSAPRHTYWGALGKVLNYSAHTLLYLDLSFYSLHAPVKLDWLIPEHGVPNLAVLKLANCFIGKDKLYLASIFKRLKADFFSLDVSHNQLGDGSLALISNNYLVKVVSQTRSSDPSVYLLPPPTYTAHDEWGCDGERVAAVGADQFRPAEYKQAFVQCRKDSYSGILDFLAHNGYLDDRESRSVDELVQASDRDLGDINVANTILSAKTRVTNLYIAGNEFSENALTRYLCATGIQCLDLGNGSYSTDYVDLDGWYMRTCGLRFATQLRFPFFTRLEYLRIHHSFVTFVGRAVNGNKHAFTKDRIHVQEAHTRVPEELLTIFDPRTLPSLRVLILTDVPYQTYGAVSNKIKHTLQLAAEQEKLVAKVHQDNHSTRRNGPAIWTGLRVLRLEMESEDDGYQRGVSISGHKDAENFQKELTNDFSFFTEEEVTDQNSEEGTRTKDQELGPKMDVLTELRKYRTSGGEQWSGAVEIIRP